MKPTHKTVRLLALIAVPFVFHGTAALLMVVGGAALCALDRLEQRP